jgi:hypothetical protein
LSELKELLAYYRVQEQDRNEKRWREEMDRIAARKAKRAGRG